jgi:hypothetical protein
MSLKYNPLLPVGLDDSGTSPSSGGTFTGGIPGSVLFVGGTASAPTFAQDNQNLNFNDTANRLSVFTTLGSEVVINGTFTGSATGWTVGSGYAYSSNTVVKSSNGTAALSQSLSVYAQREYLLTYTISAWTVGTVTPSVGSFTGTAVSANGTYTERFVSTTNPSTLSFTPSNTARFTIDSVSVKPLVGTSTTSNINTGGLSVEGSWSNGSPGTTRAMTINNDGSYSWTDYRFAGVLRSSFGANSSGGVDIYQSGGNGVATYYCNSGLTSCGLSSYNTQAGFTHYGNLAASGYGMFGSSVGAGTGSSTTPTSTLQTAGSTALKVKRITASQSLDSTATIWLADATSASACTGTPSQTACSTYTGSGQATCESHLPCTWNAGSSCSAFNYEYGMGSCSGTSGCTVDTASCSGATDQYNCEAQDDAYGGSCAWTGGNDCSPLDESTCGSYSGSGCTQNYSDCSTYNDNYSGCTGQAGCSSSSSTDCSAYDGTDQSTCEANSGCYWDGMSNCYMTCSGTYFTGCSGTYYNCTGTYNTGSCSGMYGTACTGTVQCSSYSSSGPCAAEAGCSWSSVLNATLPDGETCPDRTYWIKNDSSGGADVVILPYPGTTPSTTIEKTTSLTLASYQDGVQIAYYQKTYDCSNYSTAGACTPTGCTANYSNCSYNTDDNTCSGDGGSVCSAHNGNQSACEAQTYFSYCSGTEVQSKNWYVLSRT